MKHIAEPSSSPSTASWIGHFGLAYVFAIFGFTILCFHPSILDYTLLPRYASASLVFLVAASLLFLKSFKKADKLCWPSIDLATALLLSYFIWSTLSVFWAVNFSEAIFESQKALLGLAAFYFARWFQLNDDTYVTRLLKGLTLLTGVVLLVVGWQFIQTDSTAVKVHYELRGISGHKNLFSTVLFLLVAFLSLSFLKFKNHWRTAAAMLLVVSLIALIFLKTRSVYLGILAVVTIFTFWRIMQSVRPKLAILLFKALSIFILLAVLAFIYFWQNNQLMDLLALSKIDILWQSDTGYERLKLWEKTACVINQNPLRGVGIGNWQIAFPNCSVQGLYSVEVDLTTFQRPHNDWLWVWAETGLIGLFFYLGFFVAILRIAYQNYKQANVHNQQLATLVPLAFIIGFMIIACFSFPKERIEILLLIYSLMGFVYTQQPKYTIKSKLWTRLLLCLIIISTSFSLFLSQRRGIGEKNMKAVVILKQQKKWPELIAAANTAYSRWYTIDPTSIPIHWYRGTAYFVLGQEQAAFQDFLTAQKYSPHNQYLQNDLGTCYEKQGQHELARAYFTEAVRISPWFDDPRLNMAISFYNTGEYEAALAWVKDIRNKELKLKYKRLIMDKLNSN